MAVFPLAETYTEDGRDLALVEAAIQGDRAALEDFVRRHQNWIYNLARRMVYRREDAEDITQEVLLKVVLHLATFRGQSSLRTWMYRIVVNHVLNKQKSERNRQTISFAEYAHLLEITPDGDLPDESALPVDADMLVDETRFECMTGMLLCLDADQRMIFILGGLFGVSDTLGGEILGLSRDNFRQKLFRARRDLRSFMEQNCGLLDPRNACRCHRKTRALMDRGIVDPTRLVFNSDYVDRIEDSVPERVQDATDFFDRRVVALMRSQPLYEGPDFVTALREILNSREFRKTFDSNS
jgi:RNA polymerase sigma factor (sigma-70 family)